jgi:hypothetical protein
MLHGFTHATSEAGCLTNSAKSMVSVSPCQATPRVRISCKGGLFAVILGDPSNPTGLQFARAFLREKTKVLGCKHREAGISTRTKGRAELLRREDDRET